MGRIVRSASVRTDEPIYPQLVSINHCGPKGACSTLPHLKLLTIPWSKSKRSLIHEPHPRSWFDSRGVLCILDRWGDPSWGEERPKHPNSTPHPKGRQQCHLSVHRTVSEYCSACVSCAGLSTLSKKQNRARTTSSTVLGASPLQELWGGCLLNWAPKWESTEKSALSQLGTVHETVLGPLLKYIRLSW